MIKRADGSGCPRFLQSEEAPLKDFFDTWKFKILVGIAVFLAAIMAYAGANGRLTAAPQEILSVAVAPFQRAAAAVSNGVSSLWEKYTNIDAILEENEKLTTENAELRGQMVDYDKLKAENEAYKALTNIQEQHPEMSYVSSFVIGRDPLDSFYGFTLDKGSLDGVEANDAITSDEGYLLGVVTEVDLTSCKVMTILHPSFNAAGVVSRTRDNGIITGSADYAAEGLCILSNLSRSTLTKANDQVITTGLGGVFPPDVLVGVVQELVPEASGKSTIAVIKPGADPVLSSMCLSLPITDRRSLSMESRRKRKSSQIFKWVCYTLLMLLCTVLQTMPGLFQLGRQSRSTCCRWHWRSPCLRGVCRGYFRRGLRPDVGLHGGPNRGDAGAGADDPQLCRLRRGAALPQGHRSELFAHRGGVRGAGAGLRLAVLLLHAGLQRGVEPLFVVRAPQRGAEHPGQPAHLLGGAEDQH